MFKEPEPQIKLPVDKPIHNCFLLTKPKEGGINHIIISEFINLMQQCQNILMYSNLGVGGGYIVLCDILYIVM